MADFVIQVENSAPSQSRPAQAVISAVKRLKDKGVRRVADYGCGRLRNLDPLLRAFASLTLVDTEKQFQRIASLVPKSTKIRLLSEGGFISEHGDYDAIFCISVLHIVPEKSVRRRILVTAERKLVPGGYLVTDVPVSETYYARRCGKDNQYRDGYVMGIGNTKTFYRNYSAKEFDEFVGSSTGLQLFERMPQIKHVARIWKKDA